MGRKPVVCGIKKVEATNSAKCNQKLSEMRNEMYTLDSFDIKVINDLRENQFIGHGNRG